MKNVDGFLYGSSMEPALAPNILDTAHSLAEKSIVVFLPWHRTSSAHWVP